MRSVSPPQCGEQDHRSPPPAQQPATDREAVLTGHHDVEDDEVDGRGGQQPLELDRIGAGAGPVPGLCEVARQRLADAAVVVDDGDMGRALDHGLGPHQSAPRASAHLPKL